MTHTYLIRPTPRSEAYEYVLDNKSLSGPGWTVDREDFRNLAYRSKRLRRDIRKTLTLISRGGVRHEIKCTCPRYDNIENPDMADLRRMAADLSEILHQKHPGIRAMIQMARPGSQMMFAAGLFSLFLGAIYITFSLMTPGGGFFEAIVPTVMLLAVGGLMTVGNAPWDTNQTLPIEEFPSLFDEFIDDGRDR